MGSAGLPAAPPGLVLAGGGARGAYEVGVLYYLFVDGPKELRETARFNVLSGTSIGALNVSATAATIHQPAVGIRRLAEPGSVPPSGA